MTDKKLKIAEKIEGLVAAQKRAQLISADLKEAAQRMQSVARHIEGSPKHVMVTDDGTFNLLPEQLPNAQNRFSTTEFEEIVENLRELQTVSKEIESITEYLTEAGYGNILKDDM